MSKLLKSHETLPNLTEDGGDSPEDGLELSPHPLNIADPQIFMLSEAIKNTLESSFTGLQSTLTDISAQMEKIASRPSPFHAQRAGNRISTRTPPSTGTRVSTSRHRAATLADSSPPPRHRADISADGSPTPSSQCGGGGGGGVFQITGKTYPRKMRAVTVMQLVCFLLRAYQYYPWIANSESSKIILIKPVNH